MQQKIHLAAFTLALMLLGGCVKPAGVIFPPLAEPVIWPKPPEIPRIRYVGQLMTSADLKPDQVEALFATVERMRLFVERLHARCAEVDGPADSLLRREARRAVLAYRELALVANDGRAKGVQRQYLKRAGGWPAV